MDNPHPSSIPASSHENAGAKLLHDIRNCLSTMELATIALETSPPNSRQSDTARRMIAEQLKTLKALIAQAEPILNAGENPISP